MLAIKGSTTCDLLPYLVQAYLSSRAVIDKGQIEDRVRLLSGHFVMVLQYPLAATDTILAILKIVLHLRHFQPPYRSDLLGYDFWLDIDFLLLSEASIRCEAYTTALLFLESARAKNASAVDLFDVRVQNVGHPLSRSCLLSP